MKGVFARFFCDWNLAFEDLLTCANLSSLYNMRVQDIETFMNKVKHRLLPSNILDSFSGSLSGYNLSDFHTPDSILSTMANILSDHICGLNFDKLSQSVTNANSSDIICLEHPQKRPREPNFKLRLYRKCFWNFRQIYCSHIVV